MPPSNMQAAPRQFGQTNQRISSTPVQSSPTWPPKVEAAPPLCPSRRARRLKKTSASPANPAWQSCLHVKSRSGGQRVRAKLCAATVSSRTIAEKVFNRNGGGVVRRRGETKTFVFHKCTILARLRVRALKEANFPVSSERHTNGPLPVSPSQRAGPTLQEFRGQ